MTDEGHARDIVEDDDEPTRTKTSTYVKRDDYLIEIKQLMIECRGRELPGTFNPLVVCDLFNRQCKPWKSITNHLIEEIHTAATTTFLKMISEHCDANTRRRLRTGHTLPSLHKLRKELQLKVDELIDGVQKIQSERHKRSADKLSTQICGHMVETAGEAPNERLLLGMILEKLRTGTQPKAEEYSTSLAADVAAAYYQVGKIETNCGGVRIADRRP